MASYDEQLERYQFQMGTARGRLATALDLLTDALTLAGQHGMYCRHPSGSEKASSDLQLISSQIEDSKSLIIDTMEELRQN